LPKWIKLGFGSWEPLLGRETGSLDPSRTYLRAGREQAHFGNPRRHRHAALGLLAGGDGKARIGILTS
jgi:hypothetical protein